jgi:hypothetical protein
MFHAQTLDLEGFALDLLQVKNNHVMTTLGVNGMPRTGGNVVQHVVGEHERGKSRAQVGKTVIVMETDQWMQKFVRMSQGASGPQQNGINVVRLAVGAHRRERCHVLLV